MLVLDQITKLIISKFMLLGEAHPVITNFFSLVHWGNTGAAWSLFSGKNLLLGCIGIVALFLLYYFRRQLEFQCVGGQIAMGMIMGGILGNALDRFFRGHVVDFLYFYVVAGSGREIGYPAFNVADISITSGVCFLFLLSIFHWKRDETQSV